MIKVYDGENMILGRLAVKIAKDALLGVEVKVVNCDKVIISGKKKNTFTNEKDKRKRQGYPLVKAKLSRLPDQFVRRAIRGMLPWKSTRGKEAYNKIRCYTDIPEEFAGKEIKLESAVNNLPTLKFTTVGEVCKHLRGTK